MNGPTGYNVRYRDASVPTRGGQVVLRVTPSNLHHAITVAAGLSVVADSYGITDVEIWRSGDRYVPAPELGGAA